MISLERAIDPQTEERFCCVFDTDTCLPIEPIQRYLNYCRKRQLAANTVNTYACRLVDFWQWLEYKSLNWQDVGLQELADFVNWYLLGGPVNLYPKCYGCSSFRPSTGKLTLYERQYKGEQQRLTDAEQAGAELVKEEAKATIKAMDKWLPELRNIVHG